LPSYAGDRLSSLMTAITMKRLDDKHLDMEELRITMYAKPGEQNTLISTERGIYDLEKEEITSDTRTRIEQQGVFDMEGDMMVFDAITQKGKMTGNVKMLLYQVEENLMPSKTAQDKEIEKREGDGK
jgi:lipopolysaccharide export system protein LptC